MAVFVCQKTIQCHPHHHHDLIHCGGRSDGRYDMRHERDEWVWNHGGADVLSV